MELLKIIQIIALLAMIAFGVFIVFKPSLTARLVGLQFEGRRGITEVRAFMGGVLIALGLAPLLIDSVDAYRIAGFANLGIGAVRLISILYDKTSTTTNWLSLVSEILGAVILIPEA